MAENTVINFNYRIFDWIFYRLYLSMTATAGGKNPEGLEAAIAAVRGMLP
jgi:hypothetical protein